MARQYCVYIMMNQGNTVSYVGISSRLPARVWEHQQKIVVGFTARYRLNKLVYYEVFDDPESAIAREKQLKRWSRGKKRALILKANPTLKDLTDEIVG